MKKVLFATTALIATAGMAAAEVSLSGYGRMGVRYDDSAAGSSTLLYNRFRLQVDVKTEADNGLTFGGRIRAQSTSMGNNMTGFAFNAPQVYAEWQGARVAIGNICGAIECMPGIYMATQSADLGLTGLGFMSLVTNTSQQGYFNWDAYSSGGASVGTSGAAQGIEISYSAGDFGAHLSHTNDIGTARTAVHGSYNFNGWTVALGYQDSEVAGEDKLVLTATGKVGDVGLRFGVADNDGVTKAMLGGQFNVGAATRIDATVTTEDSAAGGETFGVGVSHSLGGGASLEAGVVHDVNGYNHADFGVRFNF
ncbi:outer membrane protein OmpU [Salinihabitans flavidus]|uniref:Outer membrane protein OmpU n=1 Tax=Salinihabitans flavidus TaxID=569882 RepID=A0A1H8T5J6_9RHOB|nr:porin [Salinihabitans flavidus]SEO86290.1 outer membrane protein OmpU [Salinihabitans flavidus]